MSFSICISYPASYDFARTMISQETRELVKATVPILEQHGSTIAKIFYNNMLAEHEELRNFFNRINLVTGTQPTALASTVLTAANNIDNLDLLAPYVLLVCQKHRSLQVKPEHYPIVGHYLLKAIEQVLGNLATPEILDAWKEAYNAIADIFIGIERELYREASWSGWKPFKVVNREYVAENVIQFTVKPKPRSGVQLSQLPTIAGQYITINVHPKIQDNKYNALRHYSICSESVDEGIKFAVKLETSKEHEDGLVSRYLHQSIFIGDEILMSAPAGEFGLNTELINQNEIPLVLMSSGIGCTTLLAMLELQIVVNPNRPIFWIQSSRTKASLPFRKQVMSLSRRCHYFWKYIVITNIHPRIDQYFLSRHVPFGADIYLCGSPSFMGSMLEDLESLGQENIHAYVR